MVVPLAIFEAIVPFCAILSLVLIFFIGWGDEPGIGPVIAFSGAISVGCRDVFRARVRVI